MKMTKGNSFVIGLCLMVFSILILVVIAATEFNLTGAAACAAIAYIGLILMCIGSIKDTIIDSHNIIIERIDK